MQEPDIQPPTPGNPVAHVELKATLLLLLLSLLFTGSVVFLLYARGVFEPTQELVLRADNAEGVTVGMDMTFAGFPIGRVRRIELGQDGTARIVLDVPTHDAHWLRTSSVFTMERSLVGATRIRAYSGMMDDPPLPPGAERTVLQGDVMADVPRLMGSVSELLDHLNSMTATDAPLNASLAHVEKVLSTVQGPQGALGVVMGSEADRRKVLHTLDETNALLARLAQVAEKTDALVAHADQQVFGEEGLTRDAQAAVRELQRLLADTRQSLQRLDAVLVEVQGIASNTRSATVDLDVLRAEVEASLRRTDALMRDLQQRWPFSRDNTGVRLP
ncbi:MAG TPA: MlaD family protein [Macromonas sp.]|nr:MlaD family protein [Macromonas sp.]